MQDIAELAKSGKTRVRILLAEEENLGGNTGGDTGEKTRENGDLEFEQEPLEGVLLAIDNKWNVTLRINTKHTVVVRGDLIMAIVTL